MQPFEFLGEIFAAGILVILPVVLYGLAIFMLVGGLTFGWQEFKDSSGIPIISAIVVVLSIMFALIAAEAGHLFADAVYGHIKDLTS